MSEAIAARKTALGDEALNARLASERIDVTLPARPEPRGTIHPVQPSAGRDHRDLRRSRFRRRRRPGCRIRRLQFHQAEHSARASRARRCTTRSMLSRRPMASRHVLRTHTSPVQVRTMLAQKPPIRIIAPGRTYRVDSDATHSPMFHQFEGLVIDEETHLGHLKWVMEEFCKAFFEVTQVEMRARPSFFPFTEPSVEFDIRCDRSGGQIKFGNGNDWLEIRGLRHGASARAGNVRHRSHALSGLRLRRRARPPRHAEIRHPRSAPVVRIRSALAAALRLRAARHSHARRRALSR